MQKLKSVRKLVATEQAARVTSFHLKLMLGSDFVLPDGQSSVDVLREPLKENSLARNLTNTCAEMWTKVCSISHQDHGNEIDFFPEWQQKLLLLTEKRIFMIGVDHSKSQQNGDAASDTLEIFNSISLEDIDSLSFVGPHGIQNLSCENDGITASFLAQLYETCLRFALSKKSVENNTVLDSSDKIIHTSASRDDNAHNYHELVLKMTTRSLRFNRGQNIYFMIKKQDYPCVHKTDLIKRPLQVQEDCSAFANRLWRMSRLRRAEAESLTNFKHIQQSILYVWRQRVVRLLLLFLIVSNFVFTVQDMENKDPDWVGFYSNAELAYTVLFSIGLALSDSVLI